MMKRIIKCLVTAAILVAASWLIHAAKSATVDIYERKEEPAKREVALIVTRTNWTPERIEREVHEQAVRYGVSEAAMLATIRNESNGSTTIQSVNRYKRNHPEWGVKKGDRELSFGLAQIHLPDHPDITKEQALDPKFAIAFMAKEFAAGRAKHWMGYRPS